MSLLQDAARLRQLRSLLSGPKPQDPSSKEAPGSTGSPTPAPLVPQESSQSAIQAKSQGEAVASVDQEHGDSLQLEAVAKDSARGPFQAHHHYPPIQRSCSPEGPRPSSAHDRLSWWLGQTVSANEGAEPEDKLRSDRLRRPRRAKFGQKHRSLMTDRTPHARQPPLHGHRTAPWRRPVPEHTRVEAKRRNCRDMQPEARLSSSQPAFSKPLLSDPDTVQTFKALSTAEGVSVASVRRMYRSRRDQASMRGMTGKYGCAASQKHSQKPRKVSNRGNAEMQAGDQDSWGSLDEDDADAGADATPLFPQSSQLRAEHPSAQVIVGLSYPRWCKDLPFRLTVGNKARTALRTSVPVLLQAWPEHAEHGGASIPTASLPQLHPSSGAGQDDGGASPEDVIASATRVFRAVFAEVMSFTAHVTLPIPSVWRNPPEDGPIVVETVLLPHPKYSDPDLQKFREQVAQAAEDFGHTNLKLKGGPT